MESVGSSANKGEEEKEEEEDNYSGHRRITLVTIESIKILSPIFSFFLQILNISFNF